MRRDHRPAWLKRLYVGFERFYVNRFLRPQLEQLGSGFIFMQPWNVEVFGPLVHLGEHISIMAASDSKVRFTVWSDREDLRGIHVGDACVINPGVRISAAREIVIGRSTMLASGVYITDTDWHGLYDRVGPGPASPVRLGDNVWVGDTAMVGKGVTIGDNSIIGARSVVLHDVPANVIAAGNPARVIRELDPDTPIRTRADWFATSGLSQDLQAIDDALLKDNTFFGWLRSLMFPRSSD